MVCLPFKPAAGTNVPANIRIVDEAHTKIMWFEKFKSPCQLEELLKQNQASDYDSWSEAPLLCKRKSTKVILWSCLGLLDLLFI
ncbi:uncharacterized protein [Procambarus clarkii]|uniref:uncharacterized protein isoform X3 n=1 Tax=Procambarus clarkii TaxID=6728 RepID=UPI0037435003